MAMRPALNTARPTKVKSKKPSGAMPASTAKPFTMRLVDVPIKVSVPPRIAVYDKGKSNFDGACVLFSFTAEMRLATTAVLLVNEDKKAVDKPSFVTDFDKLPLDRGDTFSLNQVLLVNKENSVAIGKPFLDKTHTVEATVLRHLLGPKIRVYKMRPKKKTRKTFGSRRKLTRVLINSINKK